MNAQQARSADEFASVYTELVDWQLRLGEGGEEGLLDTVASLVTSLRRDFGEWVMREYPRWMQDAPDRPRLSVDLVREFLVPRLSSNPVYFVVLDCMRLDQWRAMAPLLAEFFEIEETVPLLHPADGDALRAQRDLLGPVSRRDREGAPGVVGRLR